MSRVEVALRLAAGSVRGRRCTSDGARVCWLQQRGGGEGCARGAERAVQAPCARCAAAARLLGARSRCRGSSEAERGLIKSCGACWHAATSSRPAAPPTQLADPPSRLTELCRGLRAAQRLHSALPAPFPLHAPPPHARSGEGQASATSRTAMMPMDGMGGRPPPNLGSGGGGAGPQQVRRTRCLPLAAALPPPPWARCTLRLCPRGFAPPQTRRARPRASASTTPSHRSGCSTRQSSARSERPPSWPRSCSAHPPQWPRCAARCA
jgi:hypothetical protein